MLGADDYEDSSSDDEYRYPDFDKTRRPSLDGSSDNHTTQYGTNSHDYLSRSNPSSGGEVSGYIKRTDLSPGYRQDSARLTNHRTTHSSRKDKAEQRHLLGKHDPDDAYFVCKKRSCVQSVFIAFALILGLSGWTTFTIFQLKYHQNNTAPIVASCSEWSPWGTCTVTCGVGTQTRLRKCHGNSSQYWVADYHDSQGCSLPTCEASCSEWSHWGECSVTCGIGTQTRNRTCKGNSSLYWVADYHDSQGCTKPICKASCSEWSHWGECSVTCGIGTQTRNRTCEGNSSLYWVADYHDSQGCTKPICKARCDDWSTWGECSVTCGQGSRVRNRKCYGNSSEYWESVFHDSENCNQPICTGTWGNWNSWGSCASRCGCGVRTRDRTCSNEYCGSDYKDYLSCSKPACNGGRSTSYENTLWITSLVTCILLTVNTRVR